jgi:hypothetical protein
VFFCGRFLCRYSARNAVAGLMCVARQAGTNVAAATDIVA